MNRIVALVALLAVLATACGVERTSDDTLSATPSVETDGDAASDDDDGEDGATDGDAATTSTTAQVSPQTPPTTGAPDSIALTADFAGETFEITHGQLNEIVVPTQENAEFVQLVFGGQVPPNFPTGVLTEQLVARAFLDELEAAGGELTDEDRTESRELLSTQVATLFPGSASPDVDAARLIDDVPYLGFLVEFQATQNALSDRLAADADPSTGVPCVRHILVETEPEAADILTRLDDGEDFGELAMELSTGPSGPSGGDLGCADSTNYVPPFAEAVDNAEIGEFVGPVQTDFGWHVLVVDKFEVDGRAIAGDLLQARLLQATIDVDEALGTWDVQRLSVVPPTP